MPPSTTAKAATPQTSLTSKSPATGNATKGAATPSSLPASQANGSQAGKPATPRVGGGAPPSIGQVAKAPPVGAPTKGFSTPAGGAAVANGGVKPSSRPAANTRATPSSGAGAAGLQHGTGGSGYGMNPANGYGYGGSFMQPPSAPGSGAGGAANASYGGYGYGNSMYGMQGNGSMYRGMGMGSMYGMPLGGPNGMYSSGYGTSMMGPMGGPGSMYGMGSMGGPGSMYGMGSMGGPMGSMGSMGSMGGGYGFGGSLYGGSLCGTTGSLYGVGGTLYGGNDPQAIMSSMYGSFSGSAYGGFGSMYSVGYPHTNLGTVRKYSLPGFSYSFTSNLGDVPYHRSSFADSSTHTSRRNNSFCGTSRLLHEESKEKSSAAAVEATEAHGLRVTEREKEIEEGKRSRQRGTTDVDKDGKIVDDKAGSTNNGNNHKLEPIMKKSTSVEAPKSPLSTHTVKGGTAQTTMLSTDFRVHNVAVLERAATAAAGAAKVTTKGSTCVLDGKSYTMDEVVECVLAEKKPAVSSHHISDMIEHVLAGHNTALLVSDDGKATASANAAIESTVAKLMEELNKPTRNAYADVSASMCGLHSNNMMRDLFVDGALPKAMEVGNSPLFGPAVMNITSESIKSGEDFNKVYEAALKRGKKETLMVCVLKVKQVRKGAAGGKDDVFLSSLLIGVSRRGPKEFHDIADRVTAPSRDLFRYAVDGPSVCVHVVAMSPDLSDAQVLADCAKIGEVQNIAPRSGNVRRFVDFTEEQLKRMRERCDSATGAEKHELEGHVKRLQLILSDAQKLLADPRNTEAKLYNLETELASSPAMKTTAATTGAAVVTKESAKAATRAAPPSSVKTPTATARAKEDTGRAEEAAKSHAVAAPDEKSHSTNVATVAIVDAKEARAYSVKGLTITAGGRPFTIDEVITRADVTAAALRAKATEKVLAVFLKGYNGAVVASDSQAIAANGMASPTMAVVFAAVNRALARTGNKGVRVSIALVRDTSTVIDLTVAGAAVSNVEVASSPLFGPIVHNVVLHSVRSEAELQRLVDTARVNIASARWDEHCVVHVSVVHCFAENDDVIVSSLLATFTTNNSKVYNQVLQQQPSGSSLVELYRYAFGGAATTAFVVSVCSEDEVSDVVNALSALNTASAVRYRPPLQGSVANFSTYTAASIQKRRDLMASLPESSQDRAMLQKLLVPMVRMLDDHQRVLADPVKVFPAAYSAEDEAQVERDGAAAKKTAATPSSATASGARNRAVDWTAAAAAESPAAAKGGETSQHEDPSASCFTEPRVVVFVDRDVAAEEKKVSLGDKDYAVDEVVRRAKDGTGNSAAVAEIEARLCGVHNCALMSASSVVDATSQEEPVWLLFEQCLCSAMAAVKPGEAIRADLTFVVVSGDAVVDDLLAKKLIAAPRPLEIASSPIYGPCVDNVATVTVVSADELRHAMAKVHERAAAQMEAIRHGDVMMVGTAVLRRKMSDGDVEVASLMGTLSGASAMAFQEAVEKKQVARRLLLNCAYGGPCATVTILNLNAEDEAVQGMVSTAVALSKKQRNLVSRSGSVLAFVNYTEGTMKREIARAEAATGENKERHLQKAERLRPVVEDHRKLLDDFNAGVPAYPGPRSGKAEYERTPASVQNSPSGGVARGAAAAAAHSSSSNPDAKRVSPMETKLASSATVSDASPTPESKKDAHSANRIHSIIVITPNCNSADSNPVTEVERVDETHVKVTVDGMDRMCECDEAVNRADAASIVRADLLHTAAQQFVSGFNTALLCCDLGGSNAGPVSCVRAVHHAMETKPEGAEVYFAVNGVKDGKSRNMLEPESDYESMRVANSPVFGPCVDGSEMQPLTEVSQFDSAFAAACSAAATENAMVIVNLVLKAIQEDSGRRDVVVSSFLISLVTDPRAYVEVVRASPKSDRKLFQYAVLGSCFTVGLLGLSDKVGQKGLAECLDSFDKMRSIENRPMRNGSVRRFLAYSLNAAADVKQKLPKVTDMRQRTLYEQRLIQLETMVADSRALLESPRGRALKVYV